MPAVLTESSALQCAHGGKVVATAGSRALTVGGSPVLVRDDLLAAVVVNCPQRPLPCLTVQTVTAGLSGVLGVGGGPVALATAQGATNAGTWFVLDPAQTRLEAA
jgi:hypothetical protein